MKRAYNFNAGPTALPLSVLQKAQEEFLDFRNSGMSVMELSHRSATYEAVHNEAQESLRQLLSIPSNYRVLFLQGGASLQFGMVPLNFLPRGKKAGYVLTGSWSEKALKEAQLVGETKTCASTKEEKYNRIPSLHEIEHSDDLAYLHITSNNTIYGTQWQQFPDTGHIPLIADMSSDILSRSFDVSKFSLVYAGAQKNLGPAGLTVVILRDDLLEQAANNLTSMLRYHTYADSNSLYHTPPTFAIYMFNLVLQWVKEQGGLTELERKNREKAQWIYAGIDNSQGFYRGHAETSSRSLMNITFRLATEELEKEFLAEAKGEGFVGLNGHRSVGGCRASTYNAVSAVSCKALADFMAQFHKKHQ